MSCSIIIKGLFPKNGVESLVTSIYIRHPYTSAWLKLSALGMESDFGVAARVIPVHQEKPLELEREHTALHCAALFRYTTRRL